MKQDHTTEVLVKALTQQEIDTLHAFYGVFTINIHEIFGTHEGAAVRAEMSFTDGSEFMGIAPTHKKITIALHEFHHFKDGKLSKTWHLEDWLSMLLQTSAWPAQSKS